MSELSDAHDIYRYHTNIEVSEPRGKFGGLDAMRALQEAESLLEGNKLHVVRRYLGGQAVGLIAQELGLKKRTIRMYLEEAIEDVAHSYISSIMADAALPRAV